MVENFNELGSSQTEPYLKNIYNTGQYTWLSEQSYSRHRLLNPFPYTCITLQSYMNVERSK